VADITEALADNVMYKSPNRRKIEQRRKLQGFGMIRENAMDCRKQEGKGMKPVKPLFRLASLPHTSFQE